MYELGVLELVRLAEGRKVTVFFYLPKTTTLPTLKHCFEGIGYNHSKNEFSTAKLRKSLLTQG